MDPSLLEDIGFSPDQMLDPLHYQLFSPLHSEWHLDMESYTSHPLTENFSHGHKRGNEYGSNENDPDVTEFLESVLKDSGSCSGSDAEVVQARVSEYHVKNLRCLEELQCHKGNTRTEYLK